jgi:hypothetical protein
MVVRDYDGIDGGQLVDRERHFMEARRPSPSEWGWSFAQNQVDEHSTAVDLDREH